MDRMDFPMLHLRGRAVNVLSLDLNVPASTWVGQQIQQSWPLPRPLASLYYRIGAGYDDGSLVSYLDPAHPLHFTGEYSRRDDGMEVVSGKRERRRNRKLKLLIINNSVIPLFFRAACDCRYFLFFFFLKYNRPSEKSENNGEFSTRG